MKGWVEQPKLCQKTFRLDIGKHFCTMRWSNTGTGFLLSYLMPHACQHSRDIWTMTFSICFNLWLALKWSGSQMTWWSGDLQVPFNSTQLNKTEPCYSVLFCSVQLKVFAEFKPGTIFPRSKQKAWGAFLSSSVFSVLFLFTVQPSHVWYLE